MAADAGSGKFQFAIDRGGTFTDVWARCPNGETQVLKLLSEDPTNYPDAPREGIRRILAKVSASSVVDKRQNKLYEPSLSSVRCSLCTICYICRIPPKGCGDSKFALSNNYIICKIITMTP